MDGTDVIIAMQNLGFECYVDVLVQYIDRLRGVEPHEIVKIDTQCIDQQTAASIIPPPPSSSDSTNSVFIGTSSAPTTDSTVPARVIPFSNRQAPLLDLHPALCEQNPNTVNPVCTEAPPVRAPTNYVVVPAQERIAFTNLLGLHPALCEHNPPFVHFFFKYFGILKQQRNKEITNFSNETSTTKDRKSLNFVF